VAETAGRTGIFGSAFNPPHIGHVLVVAEGRWRLGLDRVLIVPTGEPYHKEGGLDPGRAARLEMAELAFQDEPDCEVLSVEVERAGPSFTADTIGQLITERPGLDPVLLLGADAALGLPGWERVGPLLEEAGIAVAPRSGIEPAEVEQVVRAVDADARISFFEMPRVDITATVIRERIESGNPFEQLVPQRVSALIQERGYYRA
jgi:nicotinate-nucleotide adenylyltransferase